MHVIAKYEISILIISPMKRDKKRKKPGLESFFIQTGGLLQKNY